MQISINYKHKIVFIIYFTFKDCEVEITKIEIVCPERPDGNIILYFDVMQFVIIG